MQTEPIVDLAHPGHLELLTPKPEESLHFFVSVMDMTESGREGDSVYLRAYDDYERHSLKLTASKLPGLGHVAYRTRSPQALDRRVAALKNSGFDIGWGDGDLAHGPAFVCHDPDGHKIELYYETQWYEAPPELRCVSGFFVTTNFDLRKINRQTSKKSRWAFDNRAMISVSIHPGDAETHSFARNEGTRMS